MVAKNIPKGNLSLLPAANKAIFAKKFSENKIIVTMTYVVVNIFPFLLRKFYHRSPTFARKSSTSFGAAGGSITLLAFSFSSLCLVADFQV